MDTAVSAHQRKIELQSPEDLTYLLANVRRAAAEHINEAFPPVEGAQGEDELRTRIEELVNEVRGFPPSPSIHPSLYFPDPDTQNLHARGREEHVLTPAAPRAQQYITKTFTLASPNLSVNGMPLDDLSLLSPDYAGSSRDPLEPEVVYAPFDGRARTRVEELTREEEDLLRDIAALKKSVPGAAAGAWAEAARSGLRADEEALAAARDRGARAAEGVDGGGGVKIVDLERQEDVERGYARAVAGLARMKKDMPAVVARMERARGAGSYVVTEK
ncbi:hypothetical protein JX265_000429 [Neoarthrinium moseri]|uniref:Kinetochore protein mis14 n=1 Tax=Neoarthrinium moseri TaxID=1658444 RepID=A0A9P9WYG9_9PEZI|nr:uncharacterized protein JN550_000679 [Neoarthrinium moseri]KAI1878497.1 hypothetical protein JN550_000679 [Neoarthrinium moseri]KAI1881603.1 hypothetical protein JX265_000429 [Neoarthrinium moseri]